MQLDLINIKKYDLPELETKLEKFGISAFWSRAIFKSIWKNQCTHFEEITSLSPTQISILQRHFYISTIKEKILQQSVDGTAKIGFELFDKRIVEGVLIPKEKRMTACVSSQVGCTLNCIFCATAQLKRERNLEAHEIYDQVFKIHLQALEKFSQPLSNVVYMGMGEPLLNYKELTKSIQLITNQKYGLGIAARKITISTAGVCKGIRRLAEDFKSVHLAVSLHSAIDKKRTQLMDINKSNPLAELKESLQYYYQKTGNKITLEYLLLNNFNDTEEDAQALISFCKDLPVFINLLEYNSVEKVDLVKSNKERFFYFRNDLEQNKIPTRTRFSRGKDIDAACGQLANKETILQ